MNRKELLKKAKSLGIDLNAWVEEKETGKKIQVKDPEFEPVLKRIVDRLEKQG